MKRYDFGVWGEALECLDLAQVVHLIYVVEVRLHALDGHVLVRLGRLRLEHLRERSFSLLADQPILCQQTPSKITATLIHHFKGFYKF